VLKIEKEVEAKKTGSATRFLTVLRECQ